MAQRRTLAAIIGAAAAASTLAFTAYNEGNSNTPYRDSGGVWTVCRGQTGVPMHYYTDQQCDDMLANTLAATAAQIAADTPGFTTLPDGVKTATVDFAYNVGVNAYKGSTYRRMLVARQVPAACDQLLRWRFVGSADCSVKGNNCYGVWTRRKAEQEMCRGTVH
jgi:lysozyme